MIILSSGHMPLHGFDWSEPVMLSRIKSILSDDLIMNDTYTF